MIEVSTQDTYEQHQAIWTLFPNREERKRDHLFRIEDVKNQNAIAILQSSTQPVTSEQAVVLRTKEFKPNINQGEAYRFKIVCYPTKCESKTKKIIEIKDNNERIAWLQRKLTGANVTVTSMDDYLVKSKKHAMSRYVHFEGVLTVVNAEQVFKMLVQGIGRKKHAGAGLLSLAH